MIALPDGGLEQGSIKLRRPEDRDLAPIDALLPDPDIQRFTSLAGQPGSAGASGWVDRFAKAAAADAGLGAVVVDPSSDEFLGTAELHEVSLKHRRAGAGYAVAPAHRNRGIARQALRMICGYAFDRLEIERLEVTILPGNHASVRVAEAVGFREEGMRRAYVRVADQQCDMLALSLLAGELR